MVKDLTKLEPKINVISNNAVILGFFDNEITLKNHDSMRIRVSMHLPQK